MNHLLRTNIWVLVGSLCLWSAPAMHSRAITINFTYDEEETPSYDSDGSKMIGIAHAAASLWEDYLEDSFSITIDLSYSNLDGNTLGQADSVFDNLYIQANPSSPWFIDPTPLDHSEFDFTGTGTPGNGYLGQTLYRNVGSTNQSDWFNGSVPQLLEIGYRGTATDPVAQGSFDMFSTMIHEIGHILGVNSDPLFGTWDPSPLHTGGQSFEIEPDHAADDSGHLAARSALMCGGCGAVSLRRLPSAVDILAVAADESWLNVDLPRQDFLTGSIWDNNLFTSDWEGGFSPDSADDAYIRHGGAVTLAMSPTVYSLLIAEGSSLATGAHTLTVNDVTTIDALLFDPVHAALTVDAGGTFDGHALVLRGGRLLMDGGQVDVNNLTVEVNSTLPGEIRGQGVVQANALVNEGGIYAEDGTLTLTLIAANLDGASDAGGVHAVDGDLIVTGIVPDFHSVMNIGAGHFIDMDVTWTLASGGNLNLQGGASQSADLTGSTVVVQGSVDADQLGTLATPTVVFNPTAQVTASDADDRLVLDTDAFFMGGSYTGQGAIEQQGDQQFGENTTIDVAEFDWGNSSSGQLHETYLNETVVVTINSDTTGTPTNEYRGTIHVTGATLNVNLDSGWLLPARGDFDGVIPGRLHLNPGDLNAPTVTGVPLTVEGFVFANCGEANVEADFITRPSAEIRSDTDADLLLKGTNTFEGGHFYGNGEIGQWGDTTVIANTMIDTAYYDLDGDEAKPSATTIGPGVTFTINSQRIDKPAEFFDGLVTADGGTLAIHAPGGWTIGNGGRVQLINNAGPAWVLGSHITVEGTIETNGGNEIFSTVTFTPAAIVQALQPDDILRLRAHTNYEGGAYLGGGGIIQDATAFVNAPTGIHLGFFDMDGVSESNFIELHDDLFLNVDRIDLAPGDNRFHGVMEVTDQAELGVNTPQRWEMAGTLNVAGAPGTRFRVSGAEAYLAANVNVHPGNTIEFAADVAGPGQFTGGGGVVFLGDYNPGASPAIVQFDGDLSFTDDTRLIMELGGTTPGVDHDQLNVAGIASLKGLLSLELIDGYMPTLGQTLDILFGGASGVFDLVQQPAGMPDGLIFDLNYLAVGVVQLKVVEGSFFGADFDQDGDVDGDDLAQWQGDYGTNAFSDADADGDSDGADFLAWQRQLGSGSPAVAASGIVPEPSALGSMAIAAAAPLGARRFWLCSRQRLNVVAMS